MSFLGESLGRSVDPSRIWFRRWRLCDPHENEARIVIDRITIEGEAIVCGQKLTDNQASELAGTLQELLKAL